MARRNTHNKQEEHIMTVKNNYGVEIEWNTAVYLMDDDLREELSADLAPCTEQ